MSLEVASCSVWQSHHAEGLQALLIWLHPTRFNVRDDWCACWVMLYLSQFKHVESPGRCPMCIEFEA